MTWLVEPLREPFMQRALAEIALLALCASALGAWIVVRRLAFFTHAAGGAAYPGLVVAGPWGISPHAAALAAVALFAASVAGATRRRALGHDAAVALCLVLALATGTVLASDAYPDAAGVDRLLFGTILGVSDGDLLAASAAAVIALAACAACWRPWSASAFDPNGARLLGASARHDTALLFATALAVIAALPAVGALLAASLLVAPAAAARLRASSMGRLALLAGVLALLQGTAGLLVAYHLDAPPGPAVAVCGGLLFAVAALTTAPLRRLAPAAALAAAAALAGCGGGDSEEEPEPSEPRVAAVASTPQVAALVRRVGGKRVEVAVLDREAAGARFRPGTRERALTEDADLIFRSGAGADGWADELALSLDKEEDVVDLSKSVVLREAAGRPDPSWWLDPRNVLAGLTRIRDALGSADRDGYGPYLIRAKRAEQRVRRLDRALAACFAALPAAAKVLPASASDAAYLAARFGLRQGLPGASTPAVDLDASAPGARSPLAVIAHDGRALANALGSSAACEARL